MKLNLPSLLGRPLGTPFGTIYLPTMGDILIERPEMDERKKAAVKHAVATDLAGILSYIPYVGGLVGGQLSDLHFAEIRKLLSDKELQDYIESDKKIPSNGLALLYSFIGR